jgi:hypothetical protein
MALHRKLLTDIEEWNDSRRARRWMPTGAGIGGAAGVAVQAGVGTGPVAVGVAAGLGALVGGLGAWVLAAAQD